jgi:endogenous inhibitor of DNA gyrase (YacG/DUF329 family)
VNVNLKCWKCGKTRAVSNRWEPFCSRTCWASYYNGKMVIAKMNLEACEPDKELIGKRVRPIFTDGPYTHLKRGDMGTITYISYLLESMGGQQVSVKWDSSSNLVLITGKDQYEIIQEVKR